MNLINYTLKVNLINHYGAPLAKWSDMVDQELVDDLRDESEVDKNNEVIKNKGRPRNIND